jgi:hypothetical protein
MFLAPNNCEFMNDLQLFTLIVLFDISVSLQIIYKVSITLLFFL